MVLPFLIGSIALHERWILCGLEDYDKWVQIEELDASGVKKTTDPFAIAEYLLLLIRRLCPVLVLDNYEPEESFLGTWDWPASFLVRN